jgi:hypothetical protein
VSGRYHRAEPVKDSVPLSCVPVIAVLFGEYGLTEMLFIWSVPSPAFMTLSSVGMRESHARQSARNSGCCGSRPRLSHWPEASAHLPLVRMTPPSEPTKNWSGLPGTNASAC